MKEPIPNVDCLHKYHNDMRRSTASQNLNSSKFTAWTTSGVSQNQDETVVTLSHENRF